MVASTGQRDPQPVDDAIVREAFLAGRLSLVRFTVADVLAMMRQGIIPEDSTTELIDGLVVRKDRGDRGEDPFMHGPKHRRCIRKLTQLGNRMQTAQRHAQIQLPIICSPTQMPEPDFALVRGTDDDYGDEVPRAADVYSIIEAADTSFERDTIDKLQLYARSGIQQYLVADLRTLTLLQFLDPVAETADYRKKSVIQRDESFLLRGGPEGDIQVRAGEILS